MPHCALTNDQVVKFFQYVYKKIVTSEGKPMTFEGLVEEVYNTLMKGQNNEPLALTYVSLIPESLDSAYLRSKQVRSIVQANNIDRNYTGKLIDDWEEIDNVRKFIKDISLKAAQPLTELVAQTNNPDASSINEFDYEEAEKAQNESDNFPYKPDSAYSTTGQQAISNTSSVVDTTDTNKMIFHNTRVELARLQADQKVPFDQLELTRADGVRIKGVMLSAVHDTLIPDDNLYKGKKKIPGAPGIYLVVTDTYGNNLYFDTDGKLTDENNGKLAISFMRKPVFNNGKYELTGANNQSQLQSAEEVAERIEELEVDGEVITDKKKIAEFVEQQQQNEFRNLFAIRKAILKNPGLKIGLPITDITDGVTEMNFKNPSPLKDITDEIVLDYAKTTSVEQRKVKGGVYFSIPGIINNVIVLRPKISPTIANTIAELATRTYTDVNKALKAVEYIRSMVVTNNDTFSFKVDPITKGITVKIGDNVIDKTTRGKDFIIKELMKRKLNISKTLLNNNFQFIDSDPETGELKEPVTMSYNSFIKNNFYTAIIPDYNGKIKPLNGYIKFESPSLEDMVKMIGETSEKEEIVTDDNHVLSGKQELSPITTEENETKTKEEIEYEQARAKVRENTKKALDGFFKTKDISNVATEQQIKEAKDWFDNSPLSKHIAFNNMMDIVNSNAYGTFTSNGITLYAGANFTDLYHEAWHGFTQMFLTQEQRDKLYAEVKKATGQELTNLQAEELLAEDFRKYVLSDGKKILDKAPVRNTLFRRILNFLKSLFTSKSYEDLMNETSGMERVREMYDKLYKGQLNEYTPSITNAEFGILNKGIKGKERTLTNAESQLLSDTIDSVINTILKDSGKNINNLFELKNGLYTMYQLVKQEFKTEILNPKKTDYQKALLQFAIDNYEEVMHYHSGNAETGSKGRSKYLPTLSKSGIKNAQKEDVGVFDAEGNVEEKIEEGDDTSLKALENQTRDSLGSKAGNEESMIETANKETLYLLAGITEVDKNGNPVLNELGFPKLADFDRTWNRVINILEGTLTPQDMVTKLLQASAEYPEMKELVQKLGPTEKHDTFLQFNLVTKFWQDMNKSRVPVYESLLEQTEDGSFIFKHGEASVKTDKIKANFTEYFQSVVNSPYITVDKEDGKNMLNVPKVLEDFGIKVYDETWVGTHNPDGSKKDKKDIKFTWAVDPKKRAAFVRAIGFNMSDKPKINRVIANIGNLDYLINNLSLLNEKGESIKEPIKDLQQTIRDDKKNVIVSSQSTIVKQLLELEGKYSDNYSNYSIVNAEGNLEYGHSLNNFLTITLNHLNNEVKYPTYQDLVKEPLMSRFDINKNPYIKNSIWLNSLFILDVDTLDSTFGQRRKKDSSNVKLELSNYNGVKIIDDSATANEGIKTTSLDRNSKMLQDLHALLLYGMMELPRHASKSSAFAVRVSEIANNTTEKQLYFPMTSFVTESTQIDGAVHRAMKAYLVDELTRIKWAQMGVGSNIPGYNKRSLVFNLFDTIIDEDLKSSLIKQVEKTDEKDIPALVNKFDKKLSVQFKEYFNKLEKENYDELSENPLFSSELINKANGIADGLGMRLTEEERTKFINRAFTYNAWFNNAEAVKFIYGDLAFFKTEKEEFHKRNTAYSATGTIPRTDDAAIDFINRQGRHVAKSLGLAEKRFNGTFDTAVLKDAKYDSAYVEEYRKLFTDYFTQQAERLKEEDRAEYIKNNVEEVLSPYKGMTEGDAQGWITLDSYRIFKMLQGKWDMTMESLYQKEISGITLDKFELAQMFPPIKAQYSGPINTDKLYVPGFHKFSLVPLIPSVIKGTSMEVVNRNFIDKEIDYALFESGSKIATITKDGSYDNLYEDYKTKTEYTGDYAKNNIFLDYLKEQVNIEPHFKDKVIFSTQLRKLVELGLYKEGKPITEKAKSLDDDFVKDIETLTFLRKKQLMEETGIHQDADNNYIIDDYKPLVETLHKELESRKLPDNVIDFVDLKEVVKPDGTKVYKLKQPLDLSTSTQKIEGMLQSIINNRLVRQKVNGESLIQVSTAGFESLASKEKYRNPTQADLDKWGTNDLPFYKPEGRILPDGTKVTSAMKIKRALKKSDEVLFELEHLDGYPIYNIERLNEMVKNDEWLDKNNHRSMVTMVGVRIPVQGLNSMEFMEVYEFLPAAAGNVIIPSSEIVAKSGADFDIDKLTIFFPNIKMIGGKVTLFNKTEHSLSNQQIKEKYAPRIAAAKIVKEKTWKSFDDMFLQLSKKIPFTPEDKATFDKLKEDFKKDQKELLKSIDILSDLYNKMITGKSNMSYEEAEQLSDDLYNLYTELDILRANHRFNVGQYLESFRDYYKDDLKSIRALEVDPIDKEIQALNREVKDLMNSNIKAIENSIISNIRSILEMNENAVDLLRPNGTDIVKPVADNLADKVSDYNARINRLTGKKEKTVSPTRAVETRYNLYKHESNNIGKATLGLGAVDNTFNALFNKIGAYLNSEYLVEKQVNIQGLGKVAVEEKVPVKILLDYNKKIVGEKEHVSLSHIYDTEGKNKIADVISQLMNGWVDIEKDAWIFNVNGSIEAAPVILLLNQAGTPFDVIAKFVTQPAILDYVKALRGKNNLFSKITDPRRYESYTNTVREEIFSKYLGRPITNKGINKIIKTDDYKNLFERSELEKEQSGFNQAVYLKHFIELSGIANQVGSIKMALNFDTSKSRNLFDAQEKINAYKDVKKAGILPAELLESLKNESVISSFAVQDLSINLWTKLLPLRNSALVNRYISEKLNSDDVPFQLRRKIGEKFARTFKNDLMSFILQEYALPEDFRKNDGSLWKNWFIGKNPLANELYTIKNKYKDLAEEYTILKSLSKNESKKDYLDRKGVHVTNIQLKDGVLDTAKINKYYEEFEKLINPDVKKVENPADNAEITRFFRKLAIFGFLQSGLNKSPISFTEVIPQSAYTGLMSQKLEAFTKQVSPKFLDPFYVRFKNNNPELFGNRSNFEGFRFKDYTASRSQVPSQIDPEVVETQKQTEEKVETKEVVNPDTKLKKFLTKDDYYFLDLPDNLNSKQLDDIFDDDALLSKYETRITPENYEKALVLDEKYGDLIYKGKGSKGYIIDIKGAFEDFSNEVDNADFYNNIEKEVGKLVPVKGVSLRLLSVKEETSEKRKLLEFQSKSGLISYAYLYSDDAELDFNEKDLVTFNNDANFPNVNLTIGNNSCI